MPKPLILPQIETVEAVDNAARIAAVDGIDVLFIGPADLGYDLLAQKSDRTYSDCLSAVAKAALAAGKQCGVLLRRTDDIVPMRALGLSWIAVDSDIGILREKYTRLRCAVPQE